MPTGTGGFFCGEYDTEYAEKRARIGLVHAAIGVKPSFIMPAFGIVQELSLEHLRNTLRSPEIFSAVEAFEKIMAIEAALMQDSYMQAMEYGYRLGVAADQEKAWWRGPGPCWEKPTEPVSQGARVEDSEVR